MVKFGENACMYVGYLLQVHKNVSATWAMRDLSDRAACFRRRIIRLPV